MTLPVLQTNRLIIRTFELADWVAVYRYTSQPDVMTWIPDGTFDEMQARTFVTLQSVEPTAYAVVLAATQRLIGHLVFHPWFAPRTYEVGWVFDPDVHRQGYATEAARAALAYGFETMGLHRIIATCQPQNPASFRVMEKLGMRREGHFLQCIDRGNDQWWDEYFYAILANEWGQRSRHRSENG